MKHGAGAAMPSCILGPHGSLQECGCINNIVKMNRFGGKFRAFLIGSLA